MDVFPPPTLGVATGAGCRWHRATVLETGHALVGHEAARQPVLLCASSCSTGDVLRKPNLEQYLARSSRRKRADLGASLFSRKSSGTFCNTRRLPHSPK